MYDTVALSVEFLKKSREAIRCFINTSNKDWIEQETGQEFIELQTKDDYFNLVLDTYNVLEDGSITVANSDSFRENISKKYVKWTRIFEIHDYGISYTLAVYKGMVVFIVKNSPKNKQLIFLEGILCHQCRQSGSILKYDRSMFCVNCGTSHSVEIENFTLHYSSENVDFNQKLLSKKNNNRQILVNLIGKIK